MKFSERMGLAQIRTVLQLESVSERLRIRIWNNFKDNFLNEFPEESYESNLSVSLFAEYFWKEFLVKFSDDIPRYDNGEAYSYVIFDDYKSEFLNCEWYYVFEFVEFIASTSKKLQTSFVISVNKSLEKEHSGYRIVEGKVIRITSETEISEIEGAISETIKFSSVNLHLKAALNYISNRDLPDCRNSIKESISSVEAICKIIVGNEKGTLGETLKILKSRYSLHPSLEKSFSSLYGYASDAGGIRHALKEGEVEPQFEEAKLILVTCSSFVNYLKTKYINISEVSERA
jgi:hypothetical protein